MSWYFADNQEKIGPLNDSEFQELVSRGRIQADTLVWQDGMGEWEPYRQVASFTISVQTPATVPAAGGSALDPLERTDAGSRSWPGAQQGLDYAGFWIRFGAKLIDGLILGVVFMVFAVISAIAIGSSGAFDGSQEEAAQTMNAFAAVMMIGMYALIYGMPIVYSGWFLGRFGATPGKMATGLKVVQPDGSDVSYARAFGRGAAELLSQLTMDIGYVIAAFDDEKRTLHDHICSTRVVRK